MAIKVITLLVRFLLHYRWLSYCIIGQLFHYRWLLHYRL